MAKAKKKRADKYEEKLKILGDFEDVIGVSVENIKPYNMGEITLQNAKRHGSFTTHKDIVRHGEKIENSTRYDVVLLDEDQNRTEHSVYRGDNSGWILNPLESEPFVQDEIRETLDKIEGRPAKTKK